MALVLVSKLLRPQSNATKSKLIHTYIRMAKNITEIEKKKKNNVNRNFQTWEVKGERGAYLRL